MDTLHDILHSIINHFIPHEGNDYKPHLLQKAAFVGMFSMVLLTFTLANFQALLWQSSQWLVGAVLPAVVIDLTNHERTDNHLTTLVHNPVLDAAAHLKAQDMAKGSYFSHNSPTGVTPWHWFDLAGYSYVYAGENLAVYFTDSSAVVDAWMKSPTHRANIVGGQYREIGVGTAKGKYNGYDTVFVVQLFGTPAIKAPVVATTTPKAIAKGVILPQLDVATATRATTTIRNASTPTRAVLGAEIEISASTTPLAATSEEPVTTESVQTDTMVQDTFVTNDFVAIQSDLATSQTNLEPAPVLSVENELRHGVPMVAKLATEPHRVLQFVYTVIGLITVLALFASVLIEWRQHRPVQTAYGIVLLVLMSGLFMLHTTFTAGALIL